MGRYMHAVYTRGDGRENLSAALSSPHSLFCLAPLALLQRLGQGVRLLYGSVIVKVNDRGFGQQYVYWLSKSHHHPLDAEDDHAPRRMAGDSLALPVTR